MHSKGLEVQKSSMIRSAAVNLIGVPEKFLSEQTTLAFFVLLCLFFFFLRSILMSTTYLDISLFTCKCYMGNASTSHGQEHGEPSF